MKNQTFKPVRIGWRTWKTAAAVILSMMVVDIYGATTSKLIFAMLGAMAAVQTTFKASLESCLTQVVGVIFGAVAGVALKALPIPPLAAAGAGIVLVITVYNALGLRFAPGLPCLIVVTICTTAELRPILYALGRIWDTAIGLTIGMAINTLILPYDNSRQIRETLVSLDRQTVAFLEEMFDGDDRMPDADAMTRQIGAFARQLAVFSDQRLLHRMKRHARQLETFLHCEEKSRELLARMTVLSSMSRPGRLNPENRARLEGCGAVIRDTRPLDSVLERDVVTNYHVSQILTLRRELMEALRQEV